MLFGASSKRDGILWGGCGGRRGEVLVEMCLTPNAGCHRFHADTMSLFILDLSEILLYNKLYKHLMTYNMLTQGGFSIVAINSNICIAGFF